MITRHHRLAVSLGGSSKRRNLVLMTEAKHRALHCLFASSNGKPMTVHEMAEYLNTLCDPDFRFEVKSNKKRR